MAEDWNPAGWREYEARQQPDWPDSAALEAVLDRIAAAPPLVSLCEIEALKREIAGAQDGRAFVLQGGECAESLDGVSEEKIRADAALLRSMAAELEAASGLPVIRIGRWAGQFAKPRTRSLEERDGRRLPMFRGDSVNACAFDEASRRPDPARLARAHAQAGATLAVLRAAGSPWIAHEALLLAYEERLVRREEARWYGSSAHFLWIGDRTRFDGSAHVEFLRGLANPIGVKCGPSLTPDLLLCMLDRLNPRLEPGRITLIARMGADRVAQTLPPLLRAVGREGHPVLWCSDPMHGNSVATGAGLKTRPLERILAETAAFFSLCRAEGAFPGGLHVEMTAAEVTECTGAGIAESDLGRRFETLCDPRLNAAQALQVAQTAAGELTHVRKAAA
jgi:3-deoxy-7-phosphoheptulonate synthase